MSEARRGPSFVTAALRIFDLSMGEMLWSRRTIFMALVVGSPVAIALLFRALDLFGVPAIRVNRVSLSGEALFGGMIWLLYLRFVVPVLGLFYGTALMADEIEDKTITYLFTRPIRRGAVLAGKYLAFLVCTSVVVLPSVMIVFFLVVPLGGGSVGRAFPALLTDLGLLAVGLASYGAVFAFVGAWLKRPLVIGLMFAFGWEQVTMVVPGYLRRGTVAYYLQALVPHAMPEDSTLTALQGLFRDVPSTGVSLACLAGMTAVFLWLATRVVERREYVLSD
jgi:ABC-type transport system involved in multi-copper enzyme maturation permease subunit